MCCCWKLIPHSDTEGEGDLGESMKWREQVYSKQSERQRSDIKCIYTQACFFFFLLSQSSFSSPPPPFSVTALKGSMFILKDIRRHERTHTLTCTCMWLLMYTSEWAQKLSSLHKNRNQTNNSLKSKSRLFEPFSAEARSRLSFLWSNSRFVKHLLSRSKVEKSWISCRDERWLSY